MLRADNVICGTSTTGTGTLTLAATPIPPGGVDFDVWARATGIGFGNSAAILVSYTIIEYTDSTFATAKQTEKGIGTLTLGSSSGIANATLARTTLQASATSLNSQPASQNISPGTGISIATAANTLVFISPSAADIPAFEPYIQTTTGVSNLGAFPAFGASLGAFSASGSLVSGDRFFTPFTWLVPMLAKRASLYVFTAYSGGTPVSNADMRLYAMGTDARPSKLLYDFGLLGTANASLNSTGWVQTGAPGNGFFLMPGEYWLECCPVYSGGSAGPNFGIPGGIAGWLTSGRFGGPSGGGMYNCFFSTGGSIGAAPDPAAPASWVGQNGNYDFAFALSPT